MDPIQHPEPPPGLERSVSLSEGATMGPVIYREIAPSEPLRRWIHTYWILIDDLSGPGPPPAPERVVPDGRAEILFDFESPYLWVGQESRATTATAVGQIPSYIELQSTGPVSILGARLEPGCMPRLLHTTAGELVGTSASFEELELWELAQLEEKLRDTTDWKKRLAWLDQTLRKLLLEPRHGDDFLVEGAANLMRQHGGRLDIKELSAHFRVSVRTLERRFARYIGYGPKLYSRQMRLQHIFSLIDGQGPVPWSEIALASGCFDQSHLNREFKELASESPEAFLRSQHELSEHLTGLAQPQKH